ncbi:MAG: papain-like cysteine protease family protein [Pseudomonadota bacterium]
MFVFRLLLLSVILFSAQSHASAQGYPPPIDLGITNITQQTNVWCWVAVVEQVAHWKHGTHPSTAPHQCELVSTANSDPAPHCCSGNPAFAHKCVRTGHTNEIMGLLHYTGSGYASYNPPANPMVLYNTLASNRPIILELKTTPYSGHVVVLRGMAWQPGPYGIEPVLLINDPLSYFTTPVPFSQLMPYWSAAIVVN